jgi:CRP-like cAMP-binding protein
MVKLELIEKLDIFKTFTTDELEKIPNLCSSENYQIGESIFLEGDPAEHMWIVMDGNVELRFEMPDARQTTHENTLSSHNRDNPKSQIFGWSCFTPPYKMKLSAYCTSRRCQVVKINAGELNHLMEKDTSIGFKMMRYMVQVVGYRFTQMKEEVAKFMGINLMNSW